MYASLDFVSIRFTVLLRLIWSIIPSNALKQKQLFCSLIVDIFVNVRIIRLCVNQVYGFVAFDLVN